MNIERTEKIEDRAAIAALLGCEPDESVAAVVNCFAADGSAIGYYEVNRDGSFSCTVGNDSEWSQDEDVIREWLETHAEDSVTDEERAFGPRWKENGERFER